MLADAPQAVCELVAECNLPLSEELDVFDRECLCKKGSIRTATVLALPLPRMLIVQRSMQLPAIQPVTALASSTVTIHGESFRLLAAVFLRTAITESDIDNTPLGSGVSADLPAVGCAAAHFVTLVRLRSSERLLFFDDLTPDAVAGVKQSPASVLKLLPALVFGPHHRPDISASKYDLILSRRIVLAVFERV